MWTMKRTALLSLAILLIWGGTASAQVIRSGFRHLFIYSRFSNDPFWDPIRMTPGIAIGTKATLACSFAG